MKCGYCRESLPRVPVKVEFLIKRRSVAVSFCSVSCAYWGGVQHARTGFATTVRGLRTLFGSALEVRP